jgi:hypothetical protein
MEINFRSPGGLKNITWTQERHGPHNCIGSSQLATVACFILHRLCFPNITTTYHISYEVPDELEGRTNVVICQSNLVFTPFKVQRAPVEEIRGRPDVWVL